MNGKTEPSISRETVLRLARQAVNCGDGSELSGDAIERFAQLVFLEAASPSSKSTKELSDEQIELLAKESGFGFFGQWHLWQGDTTSLHKFARAALASSSIKEDGERAEQARRYLWLLDSPTPWHVRVQQLRAWCDEHELSSPPSPLGDTPDQQEQKR